jgi:beta-lactamase regulating signal transducer with metallopeptidase domain
MNPSSLLASPAFVFLFQWTCLIALAWVAHWILRRRQARWRLILWRSVLCFGLILPLVQLIEVPGVKIPIFADNSSLNELSSPVPSLVTVKPISTALPVAQPVKTLAAASKTTNLNSRPSQISSKSIPSGMIMIAIWALGCLGGIVRLVRLNLQLTSLQKESCQPTSDLHRLVAQIQVRLNVQRKVNLQISDAVVSPFVCGLLRPAIILPRKLTQNLSLNELSALLSHEIAHLRQHDLFWCVAWRWMKTVGWFHPLVWNIPAAHNLACEQEADRVASGQLEYQDSYAQMLARLALRVLALPAVETKLTVNGSSQIARRLKYLGQKGMGVWNWKYSVAAFGLAGLLFVMTAGCKFTNPPVPSNISTKVEFKKVLVVVQDEDGKPIEDATILPDGFRVKGIHGADAYGWNNKLFGAPEKAVTDHDGKAYVKYPVEGIPEEKELTGKLVFSVSHPEYATVRLQEYSVVEPEQPIRLIRGIHLEVTGYSGSDHQPVTVLVPNLSEEMILLEDWQKKDDGVYAFTKLSPGGHTLQLMGRLPSGEIVYSEGFDFTAEKGKEYKFAVEMKPGIRLEGRIDDQVTRPIKNGRVLISVRPKEFPAFLIPEDYGKMFEKYGYFYFWKTYRPINEDGSFVFESIPPGEVDVIVHGDGFVSKSIGQVQNRITVDAQLNTSKLVDGPAIGIPQPFPLTAPITKIEVVTEPTATLEVMAKTKNGNPVEGVTIYVNPNILRMQTGIFGQARVSNEEPFRTPVALPKIPYFAVTDKNGIAVISNVPAITRGMEVYADHFQVPLQEGMRDRHVRTTFSSGTTNKFELTLEPKGADFIGNR